MRPCLFWLSGSATLTSASMSSSRQWKRLCCWIWSSDPFGRRSERTFFGDLIGLLGTGFSGFLFDRGFCCCFTVTGVFCCGVDVCVDTSIVWVCASLSSTELVLVDFNTVEKERLCRVSTIFLASGNDKPSLYSIVTTSFSRFQTLHEREVEGWSSPQFTHYFIGASAFVVGYTCNSTTSAEFIASI